MKTTIELPDDLLLEAKRKALETRTTLRKVVESALRKELKPAVRRPVRRRVHIKWVTAPGGLPPGLDVSDRRKMREWIEKERE